MNTKRNYPPFVKVYFTGDARKLMLRIQQGAKKNHLSVSAFALMALEAGLSNVEYHMRTMKTTGREERPTA